MNAPAIAPNTLGGTGTNTAPPSNAKPTASAKAPGILGEITDALADIKAAEKDKKAAMMKAGELLCKAKASPNIVHGEWGDWLKTNFKLHVRTAQRYMDLFRNDGKSPKRPKTPATTPAKNDTVSHFAKPDYSPVTGALKGNDPTNVKAVQLQADDCLKALSNLKRNDGGSAKAIVTEMIARLQGLLKDD
jgi:hypothetical protein